MTQSMPDLISLFLRALERPPGPERSAYLDGTCGDAQLRAQVDELIDAHVRASRFLGLAADVTSGDEAPTRTSEVTDTRGTTTSRPSPAGPAYPEARLSFATGPAPTGPTTPRPIAEGPGTQIGPYRLLRKIGEGGMGSVYMADQEHPIRRKVALKVIKPGMDTDRVVARFEAERQALALMDHPSIARVFDAGATDSGRPYFVMELVNGVPINQYCDQARLSMNERLALFIPVCQAIQHAHQKGIIHRDIKPANVLVTRIDGKPVPKVIDFGVAKAIEQRLTERTLFTQFGALVGTLEYMSPEQAELSGTNIDTRSDIYALGVLLYEMLTGTTPLGRERLREAAYSEILRRIREEEPPKPSTRLSGSGETLASIAACRDVQPMRLARLVRGDLDWIAMKALEKERSRRYATAFELARDIQRYLDGDPVEACPPSAAYRFVKLARKHRAALITSAAFAAMLVTLSAVSTWQAIRATRAERRARVEALHARLAESQAGSERDRALRAEAQARTEADNAQRSAAESEAVRKFLEEDLHATTRPEGQEGGLGRDATIRQAVDHVRPKIAGAFHDQPTIEAAVLNTIGTTDLYLGNPAASIRELERAVVLRKAQLGPDHLDTLRSRDGLASAYHEAGRSAEAIAMHKETLQLMTSKLGRDHRDTLHSRGNLAVAYRAAGRTAEAIALHEETFKLKTARLGPDHRDTLLSRNDLAEAYMAAGRTAEAIAMHEATLKLMTSKLGPDHPETLVSRNNLASACLAAGRTAEAIAMHEETLKLRTAKLGPEHPDTLHSRNNLALAYWAAGRTAEAIAMHEETLKLRTAKLGPDHPGTLISRNNLANAYKAAGRTAEAIAMHEETLKLRTAKLGPDHPGTLISQHNLASAYRTAGRPAEAIAIWEAMLPAARKTFGPGHPSTLTFTTSLATAQESLGRWDAALALRRELIALRRKTVPPDSPALAGDLAGLGSNLLKQYQWAEAAPVLRESLKIRQAKQPSDWSTFNTRSLLGGSLVGQQNYAEAEPLIVGGYEGLKARAARIPTPDRPRLSEAARRVVELYEAWGQTDKAAAWRAKLGLADLPADVFSP
jgi:eukaryotic-like serine/threonine-protein kinase